MNATRAQPGSRGAEGAQIAVALVLCLAVAFGVFFLGRHLLLQAESLAAPPARERRPSREAEGTAEGA